MDVTLLGERDRNILMAVIHNYIKTAYPVGSRSLTKAYDFGLSPASVRNIMADLEELGYLTQPHTSAGRVPTEKGYRFYVNSLLEEIESGQGSGMQFMPQYPFSRTDDVRALLHEVSRRLSLYSSYAAIVLAPKLERMVFQHLQFIRLRKHQILVVFVSTEGMVQTRVIETEEDFPQADLDRFSAFLNERFKGNTLQEIRLHLLEQMETEKQLYSNLLKTALDLAGMAFKERNEGEVIVEGATNILDLPEFANAEKMKTLFRAFEEKYNIFKLLDSCLSTERVQVFIGSENAFLGTNDCSLVMASYSRGDQVLGTLGIIGPTRMEYSKVIPLVDYTAKRLSQFLAEGNA